MLCLVRFEQNTNRRGRVQADRKEQRMTNNSRATITEHNEQERDRDRDEKRAEDKGSREQQGRLRKEGVESMVDPMIFSLLLVVVPNRSSSSSSCSALSVPIIHLYYMRALDLSGPIDSLCLLVVFLPLCLFVAVKQQQQQRMVFCHGDGLLLPWYSLCFSPSPPSHCCSSHPHTFYQLMIPPSLSTCDIAISPSFPVPWFCFFPSCVV